MRNESETTPPRRPLPARGVLAALMLGGALIGSAAGQTPRPPATRPARAGAATRPAPQAVSPRDALPWTPSDFRALKPGVPTLFVAGDSTADRGPDAWHRGWAAVLVDYFDADKVNLVNRARGGRSFRSFVREGLWDQLLAAVKPGDYVVIQFGHNDGGDINSANGRPDLPGVGDETRTVTRADGSTETVHSFGWYCRKFVKDVRDKGAHPIVLSITARNRWEGGKFVHTQGAMYGWAKQIAAEEKAPFLDHGAIIAGRFEKLGEEAVRPFFPADPVHTSTPGAVVNAEAFVAGLKGLNTELLSAALNERGKAIEAADPIPAKPAK